MPTHPVVTDIYLKVAEFLRAGKKFAMAVVMNDAGSTPRKAGTKAIIDEEGSIWGTIGGGLLESDARKMGVEAIRSGKSQIFDFKFSGGSAAGDDPVCGGNMRILIDPTAEESAQYYYNICELIERRGRGVVMRILWKEAGCIAVGLVDVQGSWPIQNLPFPEAIRRVAAQEQAEYFENASGDPVLLEPIIPVARLLVSGGGHVGQALARAAHLAGFEVVVIEDRAEFSDPSLFGDGIQCRRGLFQDVLKEYPIDQDTYVALVGRGHKVDSAALRACLNSPAAYIGMMGSRRKVALVKKEFIEGMLIDEQGWKKIHAPIGLDIGAETVPEIAASIVAQLIEVRRKKEAPKPEGD